MSKELLVKHINKYEEWSEIFLKKISSEPIQDKKEFTKEFLEMIFSYVKMVKNNCETTNYDSLVPQVRSILEYCKRSIFFLNNYHPVLLLIRKMNYLNEVEKLHNESKKINEDYLIVYQDKLDKNNRIDTEGFPFSIYRSETVNVGQKNWETKIQKNKGFYNENVVNTTKTIAHHASQLLEIKTKLDEVRDEICLNLCNKNYTTDCCKVMKINDWIKFSETEPKKIINRTITTLEDEYFTGYYKSLCIVNHGTNVVEKLFRGEKNTFDIEIIFTMLSIIGSYFIKLNEHYPVFHNVNIWEQKMRYEGKELKLKYSK